jgi:hypothetical protein
VENGMEYSNVNNLTLISTNTKTSRNFTYDVNHLNHERTSQNQAPSQVEAQRTVTTDENQVLRDLLGN